MSQIIRFLLILFFCCSQRPMMAQRDLASLHQESNVAWQSRDYLTYEKVSNELILLARNPSVLLRRAVALVANGKAEQSKVLLEELVHRGLTYRIDTIKAFIRGFSSGTLKKINDAFQKNVRASDESDTTLVLADSTLIPEGITSHAGNFYLGSLSQWKIVRASTSSPASDFVTRGKHNLWSVVGIKTFVDANELWACSASEVDSINGYSALLCFDLVSGKLKQRFSVAAQDGPHFFNDLVISKSGDVYLTDSKGGAIYQYNRGKNEFGKLLDTFVYPNGITLNEDGSTLYVADARGIHRLTLSDGKHTLLDDRGITYTTGIDGLYYYKGDLIAIQDTGMQDDRVVRFSLAKTKIRKAIVLQGMRSDFIIPTTGTISDGYFYFIANSHLRNLRPNMELINMKNLTKPVVLRIKLR